MNGVSENFTNQPQETIYPRAKPIKEQTKQLARKNYKTTSTPSLANNRRDVPIVTNRSIFPRIFLHKKTHSSDTFPIVRDEMRDYAPHNSACLRMNTSDSQLLNHRLSHGADCNFLILSYGNLNAKKFILPEGPLIVLSYLIGISHRKFKLYKASFVKLRTIVPDSTYLLDNMVPTSKLQQICLSILTKF